jgi:acyl carrier protein
MVPWPPDFENLIRTHCRFLSNHTPIDGDALLTTLGADSLQIVELIVGIEDMFDLVLPQSVLTPEVFATPATIWKAVSILLPDADRAPQPGR